MSIRPSVCNASRSWLLLVSTALAAALLVSPVWADAQRSYLKHSSIPSSQYGMKALGATDASAVISINFVLSPRNPEQLDSFVQAVTSPGSKLYGQYLTPQQFKAQFGPTDDQVNAVKSFISRNGLTIDYTAPNNLLIHVSGTVGTIDTALKINLKDYNDPDANRTYFAPDREPTVDASISPLLDGIAGLSNKAVPKSNARATTAPTTAVPAIYADRKPLQEFANGLNFTGHKGLSPSDATTVYNLTASQTQGYNGAGQVIGLFEVGTDLTSDVSTWEKNYNIRHVPTSIISVDNYDTSSTPGGSSPEYVLDVDMMEIWASGATQLRIYDNGGSGETSLADSFTAMANDSTRPNVISDSYYSGSDADDTQSELMSEYTALEQLASQGQSVFCASGDAAAWADQTLSMSDPNMQDPGSQVYLTSVGGTDLSNTTSEEYSSETSWFDASDHQPGKDGRPYGNGGGGGISQVWPLPYYQKDAFSFRTNPQGSGSERNAPDVSLYGDYDTGGYDIYITTGLNPGSTPGWNAFNGTSASSPLWAGFTAGVNQERLSNHQPVIGFANPAIYAAAESSFYSSAFHDINDDSTNGYYEAVSFYDNSTGWGSFNGANILQVLAGVFVNSGAGSTQVGTQLLPFAQVSQGVNAAGVYPTTPIYITPGDYDETLTITKPVTLYTNGSGTVTIGE